jgi:hypothetical protein
VLADRWLRERDAAEDVQSVLDETFELAGGGVDEGHQRTVDDLTGSDLPTFGVGDVSRGS